MKTTRALAAALAGGWLAIGGASAALAQAALETGNPIEGAIDFHVHSAPDAFARNISDIETPSSRRAAACVRSCSRTTSP